MSVTDYLEQARHNRQVADVLSQGSPVSLQRAVTCIFYTALHYVNAYLLHHSQPTPSDHGTREYSVRRHMRAVYPAYRWLKTESERARYCLVRPTERVFERSRQKVGEIEQFVNRHVSRVH